jgi:hypothetical protein
MDNTTGIKNIEKMYDKLTYFDQYGASVLLFIITTILLIILVSYCFTMINIQPIIDDWPNQRCKPYIIPFAGWVTKPDDTTSTDYTLTNFTYCTQNILSGITGTMVEPITFVTNTIKKVLDTIKEAINSIRAMFDKIRVFFKTMAQELMGRIMNMMIPLQKIIISMKDFLAKIQGSMTAGLFTLFGAYYTLKSLMGAIAQFIITILIALAIMIAVFWLIPFTWGAAIANTAIFVAIAIPMTIILVFMIDVLKVQTSLSIPSVKCFDKNTFISMNDGTVKKIIDVNVGDILSHNNSVTGKFKVETKGSDMYNLNDIIVSDSHIVKHGESWVPVSNHPAAKKMTHYEEPYLYCLNTSSKIITINNHIFTDWDEISEKDINTIFERSPFLLKERKDIHKFLDGGFTENTIIQLKDGTRKLIKDIKVGDILINTEYVYGIVEINGLDLHEQNTFTLGNTKISGGPNLIICDKNISVNTTIDLAKERRFINYKNYTNYKEELEIKEEKLYHLLTDKKTFNIENIKFYDYNASIDMFLDKSKGKLLSMKYV